MDRNGARGEKWGLHPISARFPKDETPGEASSRWNCRGLPHNLGLGLCRGVRKGAPAFVRGRSSSRPNLAILSEVMASGAELIRKIKEQIEEVDPNEVHEISS